MKKQAHYTPDTPIKASAQAAGYLREDFRDLDHEESWILLLNGAHNHPSGNPAPSASDMNETNKLKKACDIFDISLLDHIILADTTYYSFAEETQNKF